MWAGIHLEQYGGVELLEGVVEGGDGGVEHGRHKDISEVVPSDDIRLNLEEHQQLLVLEGGVDLRARNRS